MRGRTPALTSILQQIRDPLAARPSALRHWSDFSHSRSGPLPLPRWRDLDDRFALWSLTGRDLHDGPVGFLLLGWRNFDDHPRFFRLFRFIRPFLGCHSDSPYSARLFTKTSGCRSMIAAREC